MVRRAPLPDKYTSSVLPFRFATAAVLCSSRAPSFPAVWQDLSIFLRAEGNPGCLEAELLTDVQQRLALLSRDMDTHNGQRIPYQPALTRG